jgi:hypothetical protein
MNSGRVASNDDNAADGDDASERCGCLCDVGKREMGTLPRCLGPGWTNAVLLHYWMLCRARHSGTMQRTGADDSK